MSALAPLSATELALTELETVYASGSPIVALIALLLLLFEKQVITAAVSRRISLSRCLDVGLAPLAMAAVAIFAYEIAALLA